jgi:hypothetical protein
LRQPRYSLNSTDSDGLAWPTDRAAAAQGGVVPGSDVRDDASATPLTLATITRLISMGPATRAAKDLLGVIGPPHKVNALGG